MTGWPRPDGPARVGTDLVNVARMARSLDRFGDRLVRRVFTDVEAAYCDSRGAARVGSYAARFAAKEAVMKVLGAADLTYREVEIDRGPDGALTVRLSGRAAVRARESGLTCLSVSVSDEDGYASAVALGQFGVPVDTGPGPARSAAGEGEPVSTTQPAGAAGAGAPDGGCRVPLRHESPFPRIQQIIEVETARAGRPRYLTQAVAGSPAAWQATTRALQLYTTLRTIPPALVDLLCLWTSMLNGCRYCIDDAAGEALGHGLTGERLLALTGDHSTFTPAEAAALRYARALTRTPHRVDEDAAEVQRHFGTEGLLEITTVVAMKNFWNRFATGLRIPAEGKCADPALFAALLAGSDRLAGRDRPGDPAPHDPARCDPEDCDHA